MYDVSNEYKIKALNKAVDKVYNANSRIKELDACIQNLNNVYINSVKINDVIVYREHSDNALKGARNVSYYLNGVIIPSLKKTIDNLKKG